MREADPDDLYRLRTVQLYDDFKINGINGTRELKLILFPLNFWFILTFNFRCLHGF